MVPVEYSSFSFNQTQMWSSLPATCTPQGCHTVGGTEFHEQPSQTPWSASTKSIPRPFTLEASPLVSPPHKLVLWPTGFLLLWFISSRLCCLTVPRGIISIYNNGQPLPRMRTEIYQPCIHGAQERWTASFYFEQNGNLPQLADTKAFLTESALTVFKHLLLQTS